MPTDSGRFFGMLTDGVKIFETSPQYSAEGEESSVSFTNRSNPPPQLAKKNFVNVGANVENYFFFVCVIIVFFMETGSKLITVNFFQPQIHRKWRRICVRCADDKDSYRKNAKMTYYLFCPPFHSESKELTTERTT